MILRWLRGAKGRQLIMRNQYDGEYQLYTPDRSKPIVSEKTLAVLMLVTLAIAFVEFAFI